MWQGRGRKRRRTAALSSGEESSTPAQAQQEGRPHWAMIFDLRERETEWTEAHKHRLVRLIASQDLGEDLEVLDRRLRDLITLIPDLGPRVSRMQPKLLARLLQDRANVAEKLLLLRQALPLANLSVLIAGQPDLLLKDPDWLATQVATVAEMLDIPGREAGSLVERYPRFLDVEALGEVLEELQRMFPQGDARATLVRDPTWLLRVERGTKRLGPHPDDI
ncbi:hypothetical protein WJX72_005419 [[Myrmecia] bisecta]|uniref:Uncharacterized protein n=1 Tax=[Myrmecia] bisecta TaxID=41462 RepID=A0AAW1QRL4_9CHLO